MKHLETLIILVCGALFVTAAWLARAEPTWFDREIMLLMRNGGGPVGPGWFLEVMRNITALGSHAVLVIVVIVVATYLLLLRDKATAIFLVAAAATGSLVNTLLKVSFARARPDFISHLAEVATASFPSGHAAASAVIYLTLGALLASTHKSFLFRAYYLGVAIAIVALVGLSRIYLGVHYPTDVIAGWCFGTIWALGCGILFREFQRRRIVKPAENP